MPLSLFSSQLDPGELITAIPALLGYCPTDSVVLVGFTATLEAQDYECVLRADLPATAEIADLAVRLSTAVIACEIDAVAVVMITEAGTDPHAECDLPERALQQALQRAFWDTHVEIIGMVWTPRTEPGLLWRSYTDPIQANVLPDSRASRFTAAIAPDPAPVLARRAASLGVLSPVDTVPAAQLIRQLLARFSATPADEVVLDEDWLIQALQALTDSTVRDACLGWALSDWAESAQRLWTVLTRSAPERYVAHPASLLAATAYIRGDRLLANVAVRRALAADSEHVLAKTVSEVIANRIPPDVLRQLLIDAVQTVQLTRPHDCEPPTDLDQSS